MLSSKMPRYLSFFLQEGRLKRGENVDKSGGDEDDKEADVSESAEKAKKKSGFMSVAQAAKSAAKRSPKGGRKKTKPSVALMKVFPNELESQPEFDGFTEWLQTFDLYRGKQGEEEFEDDCRVVGKFKVVSFFLCIYNSHESFTTRH